VFTTDALATALADRYTIDRLIGEGGMARVFLARDLRHNRRVALKVLRPDLGAVVGVERFQAEIEVTANLQHPNLLPLFDSGVAGDLLFYVMPYIEGESLRARINREKQLPVDEAVRLASAVAGALDYAHRHGVIHRDLKPENILLHDGQPLVADFGIALAISNASGARITQTGISLGTPQYMSPEQATGDRAIDARTDIYSLGAVTYEMLVGEAPHVGSTSQAVIARVLSEKPRSIRASRASVPIHVDATVEKALEKLPADRWATAREFAEALSGARPVPVAATDSARAAAPAMQASRRVRVRDVVAWLLAGLFASVAIAEAAYVVTRHEPTPVAARFPVELPDSLVTSTSPYTHVAISHDGRRLAVVCRRRGAAPMICVRSLDDSEFAAVRGSEGAASVSLSYDGEWLAFIVAGRGVFKLPIVGGAPQLVASNGMDAGWGESAEIVFLTPGGLFLAPPDGSPPRLLLRDSTREMDATLLPGGRDVLASRGADSASKLVLMSIADGHVTDLHMAGFGAKYAEGRVVFARPLGLMYSAPFSLSKRAFTGPATLLLQGVGAAATDPKKSEIAVAGNGTLVYIAGSAAELRSMVTVDRQGVEQPLSREDRLYGEPRVSPDGKRVVVRISESVNVGDVWIYDVAAGSLTPLTTDKKSLRPEWSRDGTRIITIDNVSTDSSLVQSRPWDGNGGVETLRRGAGASKEMWVGTASIGPPHGWSAFRVGSVRAADIFIAPTDSLQALRPFVATPAAELMPRVSPNGRLLAYSSSKSGRMEVYVRPIPGPGPVVTVSTSGGSEPIWSSDGTSLFYRGPTRMMVATVVERPAAAVTKRDSLFIDRWDRSIDHGAYDVFPDGKRFVMTRPAKTATEKPPTLFVVLNWPQLVGKQSGAISGR
jgi:serine/threonine-protein kinase